MNFKIHFKEPTVLTINDKPITFMANKTYGFKDIAVKDIKAIKKQVMRSSGMTFTATSDFTGCYNVIMNVKEAKDKIVDNIIAMNKGKKNKNIKTFKTDKQATETVVEGKAEIPENPTAGYVEITEGDNNE